MAIDRKGAASQQARAQAMARQKTSSGVGGIGAKVQKVSKAKPEPRQMQQTGRTHQQTTQQRPGLRVDMGTGRRSQEQDPRRMQDRRDPRMDPRRMQQQDPRRMQQQDPRRMQQHHHNDMGLLGVIGMGLNAILDAQQEAKQQEFIREEAERQREYEMKKAEQEMLARIPVVCPHCGAPTSGKLNCEYCDSYLLTSTND